MSCTNEHISSGQKRIAKLSQHLMAAEPHIAASSTAGNDKAPSKFKRPQTADPEVLLPAMKKLVKIADPSDHELKEKITNMMISKPELFDWRRAMDLNMQQNRDLAHSMITFFAESGEIRAEDVVYRPLSYMAGAEVANYASQSFAVKLGVHSGLFAGSIICLGTDKHQHYLPLVNKYEIRGSFGLTEMGHGSNARFVETTATFDKEKDEFVIHSPTPTAQKYFIGGSVTGTHTVVLAQMFAEGKDCGVQAFVFPLRDQATGQLFPSVKIADCGPKMGLLGVDNGRMMFDNHRVPRDALLDKYGYVTKEGKYVTEIESNTQRFALMIGALVNGRVGLVFSSLAVAKLASIIPIKYSADRLQFGPPGKPEIPILNYLSHQRRLFPLLAKTVAYHFAVSRLVEEVQSHNSKKVHIMAAGMKALITWHVNESLSVARQCCGGQGYLSENRLGELKAGVEIYTTFEGDNTVLLQQVAASLLKEFKDQFVKGHMYSGLFSYLANEVTTIVKEKNPAAVRKASKSHLLSSSFHHEALRFRKKRLVSQLASQLHSLTKSKDFFTAWNMSLDLVIKAAIAHVDYIVFKSFARNLRASVQQLKGEEGTEATKQIFKRLKNLYALTILDQNLAFYLEEGYFAPTKSKAINKLINYLCYTIRPYAPAICDSFNVHEFWLPEIAKGTWIQHNTF